MHPLFHPLFVDYCSYFNGNEDYFECHEVLEEYWKEIAPGEKHHPLVGYVQLATGLYHWRRGNLLGANRILQKALTIFEKNDSHLFYEYINREDLLEQMHISLQRIHEAQHFVAFKLPIVKDTLQLLVSQKITSLPPLSAHFIMNKHMLRDRSDILAARESKKRSQH
ncbi:hypothetical protein CSE16_05700 [Solibacillus sp. R5-41]|uniref:DUF309 domain-containing protein n=1 Tax=Solibacillus sp. R5-41 TaxID=2048654 RepID=UPI000C124F9D|nr:DUF309 domain-containing protein [Solibacillus sp. R5-41]ATP39586.1 hypothetical protein CSE16_05700 [Solibacillus sp. R5-41]